MVEKSAIESAVSKALEQSKGKRKFVQTVDLAINFREVDFKKPENRLNVDVQLPFPATMSKVVVFADGELALNAKKAGADLVIEGKDIAAYATDESKRKQLAEYSVLSSPQLIASVGKSLGQFLSVKGKLPRPIMPNANLNDTISRIRATISVRAKGKYLPVVHCAVGKENQKTSEITENILSVLELVTRKIPESQISQIFVKTTMGQSVKIL